MFLLLQAINLPLMVAGWFICLYPPLAKLLWLWWNQLDPPKGAWLEQYVWLAWRNPVNNLRLVPGVSKPGRPLWYKTWFWKGKQYYYKFGWMPHEGYPACSAGSGRGY